MIVCQPILLITKYNLLHIYIAIIVIYFNITKEVNIVFYKKGKA